jgi:hypothetical protein
MPLILPGNVASAIGGGYEVANSCRFNDGDSPQLTRVNSEDGNLTNWTFSIWVKRSTLGTAQKLLQCRNSGGTQYARISFNSSDQLDFSASDNTNDDQLTTNRVFRDVSAWYHIVVVWDSDNATAGNRMRFFINGTEETSFATDNNPATDQESMMSKGTAASTIGVGYASVSNDDNFDGYLAEAVFLDGTAVTDATSFGEFDSDSPTIWKPIDVSGLTFGDQGFYLDFEDSADLGDDESGNGNDFTEANLDATDQATDTPTNNFATFNSIHKQGAATHDPNFSEGNVNVTFDDADDSTLSTIGVTSGKWYCEFKVTSDSADPTVGVSNESGNLVVNPGTSNIGSSAGEYGYFSSGNKRINGGGLTAYGDSFTTNDIISIALDLENGAIWFAKNGTWQDSATAGEIEAGTTTNAAATSLSGTFFFGCSNSASGTTGDAFAVNFGNPSYANSSDAADANRYGAFEYAPPSGFYALCTKNLAEFG